MGSIPASRSGQWLPFWCSSPFAVLWFAAAANSSLWLCDWHAFPWPYNVRMHNSTCPLLFSTNTVQEHHTPSMIIVEAMILIMQSVLTQFIVFPDEGLQKITDVCFFPQYKATTKGMFSPTWHNGAPNWSWELLNNDPQSKLAMKVMLLSVRKYVVWFLRNVPSH